jgi:sulfatase maturation enzyme AslB (radical SAM superfamily)
MLPQNKFCKALSNAVSFRTPGSTKALTFNPCCLYNDYYPFHPVLFERKRTEFTNANSFLPGCSKCELKEKTHGYSLRTITNQTIDDCEDNSITKLEIVVDTTCNAACIQCGNSQSSLWRKQYAERDNKKVVHIQPKNEINSKVAQIKKLVDINKVKQFHFWGGEPLLTDTHMKFISEIENPEDVFIFYTSNGSIFPDDDVLKVWSRFKDVSINFSIDDLDDRFYYIRWPLKWEKVKRNLELFKNNVPSNMNFHINVCVLPLNLLTLDELMNWFQDNFSSVNGVPISANIIRGEGTLDIANTPLALREKIWSTFPENHEVCNILKEVPILDPNPMLGYLDSWDKHRNLDWRKIFPEVAKYF